MKRTIRHLLLSVSAILCCTVSVQAESVVVQAEQYFRAGQYEDALVLYRQAENAEHVDGMVGASRTLAMIGRYNEAIAICRDALAKHPAETRLQCELAEILIRTGQSAEALELLESAATGPAPTVRSLVQYGRLLQRRGNSDAAAPWFELAVESYNLRLLETAEDLAMAAVACWALESFHDANTLFREALHIDPSCLEAQVLWGDLFLEKYNDSEARRSYAEVLQRNDRYVPAQIGMARSFHNSAASREILEESLKINPQSTETLAVLAEYHIEADNFDDATAVLHTLLAINPESLEGLTLSGAVAFLRENHGTFERIRRQVHVFNPMYAEFYAKIAEISGRKYLFDESVRMARQAVALDPDYVRGRTILGMNLLRLGEETEGMELLEEAFAKDPFNFWTKNMLTVLDTLNSFETRTIEHFVVRMHRDDADVLWPYLQELLEECWSTLTTKYDFIPETPILVEVFHNHEDFAVRTSGLPDIGPLVGVCFGRVITLDSPRAFNPPGHTNWQEIIWHEFVHVITLQMTRNRIPRWLAEGVSVFEEHNGRPEWGRNQDLDLIQAVQQDKLLGIRQLNEGFSQAKTTEDLGLAYYQSSLVVEYIAEKHGFEQLLALIAQYATLQSIDDIFQTVFQQSPDTFEKLFFDWIDARVAALHVYVPKEASHAHSASPLDLLTGAPEPIVDIAAVEQTLRDRIAENASDFQAHLELGLLLYDADQDDEAIRHLTEAKRLLPEYARFPNPYQVLANIHEERGDETAMIAELEALVAFQQHAFGPCVQLSEVARERGDHTQADYYLLRAIAVNPYDEAVHTALGQSALERGAYDLAVQQFRILAALDKNDPARAHTDLAEALLRSDRKEDAKRTALTALEIAPTYERAQSILLEAMEP